MLIICHKENNKYFPKTGKKDIVKELENDE